MTRVAAFAALASLAATVAACAEPVAPTPEDPVVTYTCRMIFGCGERQDITEATFIGTVDEVRQATHEWVDACHTFEAPALPECGRVLCATWCESSD